MQSKVMHTLLGQFAKIELDLISVRTKEGFAAARVKGSLGDRLRGVGKSRLNPHQEKITELIHNGS